MAIFRVSVINKDFASCNDIEVPSAGAARNEALKGALEIGGEEVRSGKPFFGAEIRVQSGDEVLERLMIAIGATPLSL